MPGFAIGAGSQVSPLGTVLGPIPSLPVLGALPTGEMQYGFLGLAVPIVIAFLAGALLAPRITRDLASASPLRDLVITALVGGLAGGLLVAGLCAASAGSVGAGRLLVVGPDPLLVGAIAAVEFAFGCVLGALAGSRVRGGGSD